MATQVENAAVRFPSANTAHLTIPDGALKPATWSSTAADAFPASKAQHATRGWTNFGLPIGTTPPVAREEVIFTATAAGTINKFAANLDDTGTSTDVDFVLKKNGSTIMASDLTITHATSDRVLVEGSLTSSAFVAGDQFSIQLVVNSGTDAHGPYAFADFVQNNLA